MLSVLGLAVKRRADPRLGGQHEARGHLSRHEPSDEEQRPLALFRFVGVEPRQYEERTVGRADQPRRQDLCAVLDE